MLKKYNPTSPGVRSYVSLKDDSLYRGSPFPGLVKKRISSSGRNNQGRITVWHRGGAHKRKYRVIDWFRKKDGIVGKVIRVEYDPNRTSNIALVCYSDGTNGYIVCPKNLIVGNYISSGEDLEMSPGNCLQLKNIMVGSLVHCVELYPGSGAKIARSAGSFVRFLAIDGDYAIIRLKSGEMRKVLSGCKATVGQVGNSQHSLKKLGKAGRVRNMGRRPVVRGVAMNPVDHPLGGGEGKTSGGRVSCTPWGVPNGKKTRRVKNSDKFILKSRKK